MSAGPQILPPPTLPQQIWQTPICNQQFLVNPNGVWGKVLQFLAFVANSILYVQGTHAQRLATPATSYNPGSFFFETDRLLLYIAIGGQWYYALGVYSVFQDALPTDLIGNDIGLRVNVKDYAHELNWTGTQWQWAPSDAGSGFVLPFQNPPNPGTGWQLCDGSANIPNLNGDGSLSFTTVPSTPGSYYRQ